MQRFHDNLIHAVRDADQHGRLPGTAADMPAGLSGDSIVGLLQRLPRCLAASNDACYVEIGVLRGLTLLSTARANPGFPCFGIDNFSLFDEQRENMAYVQSTAQSHGLSNAHVINADFEDALIRLRQETGGRRVGVFFVDGPHDYRSQLMSLLKARPMLSDEAIIVVDDANYAHVRQANADFLACSPEFKLAFEAYTPCHPANMSSAEKDRAMAGWWNGVNVLVTDPDGELPDAYPPTGGKACFEASHDVFRHEFADLAHEALQVSAGLLTMAGEDFERQTRQFRSRLADYRARHPDRFKHQNTDSAALPRFCLHVSPTD